MLRLYVVAYFLLLTLNSGVVRGDLVNADSATVLVQVHLVSEESGTGSGSFITSDGHILTNYHVIEDALEISIYWKDSNSFIKARVAWQRPDLDLAILKIERTPRATISFPKDFASIQKGNEVFAFGYPSTQFRNMQTLEEDFSGVEPTLTTGIISRFSDGSVPLIQHTAEIRPGSSGGPLTDKCGRIIGVNTLGIGDEKTDYFSVDARSFFEEILKKISSTGFDTPSSTTGTGNQRVRRLIRKN
jgi:S1-C subfamily serine protease